MENRDKEGRRGRRGLWLVLVALAVALAAVAAGCGGGGGETTEAAPPPAETGGGAETGGAAAGSPIKIGIVSDCGGDFAAYHEFDLGGAYYALVKRGATPINPQKPTDGIENLPSIGGHPIQITGIGCADSTPDKAIQETRRLVEQLGSDIQVGPLSGDEGIAIANYAKEHPDKTFVNGTSGAQDTTLKVQAPNLFRFNGDGAQWSAGLGNYAYTTLGWRTAAIIGDDYSFPYTSLAGFVAEFCALGGQVTQRIWPPIGTTDYSSYITQLPDDVDGTVVGVGGAGLIAFIKQYVQQKGALDPKKFMGNVFWPDPLVLKEVGDKLVGGTYATSTAGDSTDPGPQAFIKAIDSTWPGIAGAAPSIFTYNYYNNMEAVLEALEAVNGDLSNNHTAFNQALTDIGKNGLDAAWGKIVLDQNRQAIADNFVGQVVTLPDGSVGVKTILKVPNVEESFGGYFTPDTPSVDRTNPVCAPGTPPPWVGKEEPVNYGG